MHFHCQIQNATHVCITCTCTCYYCRKQRADQTARAKAETNRFAHDNVVYMHHNEIQRESVNITPAGGATYTTEDRTVPDTDAVSIAGASSIHTVYEEIDDTTDVEDTADSDTKQDVTL